MKNKKKKLSAIETGVLARIRKHGHAMKFDKLEWLVHNVLDVKFRKVKNHVIESLIEKGYLELAEVRGILRVTVKEEEL